MENSPSKAGSPVGPDPPDQSLPTGAKPSNGVDLGSGGPVGTATGDKSSNGAGFKSGGSGPPKGGGSVRAGPPFTAVSCRTE